MPTYVLASPFDSNSLKKKSQAFLQINLILVWKSPYSLLTKKDAAGVILGSLSEGPHLSVTLLPRPQELLHHSAHTKYEKHKELNEMSKFQLAASVFPWATKSSYSKWGYCPSSRVMAPSMFEILHSEIHLRRRILSSENSQPGQSSLRSLLSTYSRGSELNPRVCVEGEAIWYGRERLGN